MTVKLLSQWGDYPPGALYTTDATTEAAMNAAGLSTSNLSGGVVYTPPGNSPNRWLTRQFVYVGPWEGRPANSEVPFDARMICTSLLGRPEFWNDGTNWRVFYPSCVARNSTILSGLNQTGEQYLGNLAIPGGLLFDGARLEWRQGYARSDTTDATVAVPQRVGNTGTIADPQAGVFSNTACTSSQRAGGGAVFLRVVGNTLIKEGNASVSAISFGFAATSTAHGTASPAIDFSLPVYFGACVNMAAATGPTAETGTRPQITLQELWMLP